MTRVMLLIPTASYRAPDFMAAAGKLGLDVVVASDIHQPLADMYPGRWLSLPYHDAERGAAAVARYADRFPLDAVIAVVEARRDGRLTDAQANVLIGDMTAIMAQAKVGAMANRAAERLNALNTSELGGARVGEWFAAALKSYSANED